MKKLPVIIVDESKVAHYGYRGMMAKSPLLQIKACTLNTTDALDKLKDFKRAVLLLDTLLPDLDLKALTADIKERYPGTIIIVSSYVFDYTCWQQVKNKMVDGYLLKKTCAKELEEAAKAGLEKKTYLAKCVSDFVAMEMTAEQNRYEKTGWKFTQHENDVMYWLLRGKSIKFIANKLHISNDTVQDHRARIFEETKTETVGELIILAIKKRIITEAEILKWK